MDTLKHDLTLLKLLELSVLKITQIGLFLEKIMLLVKIQSTEFGSLVDEILLEMK